jgi:nucleotide-binding universal stress UspA family protein
MKPSIHEILKLERVLATTRPSPRTVWQRLLVPVDFTEGSREALKLAVSLAADPEDRITLLHVIPADSLLQRGNAVMMTLSRTDAELQAEAETRLRRWAGQEAGPDIEIEIVVRSGPVHREILHVAETHSCDVIVLATRAKNWFQKLFLGSLTRRLVRTASCAVITLRPPEPRETIPVDFKPDCAWRTTSSLRPATNAGRSITNVS